MSIAKRTLKLREVGLQGDPSKLHPLIRWARAQRRVALVCMPFVSYLRPSIQIGLLKSIASAYGFPTTTFHLNLDFAHRIGPEVYEILCEYGRHFLGDWLFSLEAFGKDAPDLNSQFLVSHRSHIAQILKDTKRSEEDLLQLRQEIVEQFLDYLMETIEWDQFDVVGFTSTFQQNLASFALATRIKRQYPSVKLLFGGANFEGDMGIELARSIPCIDYAIIGEGDRAFPEFLIALQEGRDPAEVPGVVCRRNSMVTPLRSRSLFARMDDLPLPDYDEYFERLELLGLLSPGPQRHVRIPFESARGCWWGQKHHCTFCGLNGQSMTFRVKSPERLQEELSEASQRYRSFQFQAVDNILDMSYLKTFLPQLIQAGTTYNLFYEIKANLTRDQLKLLSESGVKKIQPGIESLNSHILKLMSKGITGIQNVNTLRWALYYHIDVAWNILYGFPGETIEDYLQQEELLPSLWHLQPPSGIGRIWMERFSPIFSNRQAFPTRYIRPHTSYGFIYPRSVDIERIAYFFDYEFEETLPDSVFEKTHRLVGQWQKAWRNAEKPRLTYWSTKGFLQIEDLRDPAKSGTFTFTDPLAGIYTALSDRPGTAAGIKEKLLLPWPVTEIEEALNEFCRHGLMMRDGDLFLSLALPDQ